jgi:hypothetical protein
LVRVVIIDTRSNADDYDSHHHSCAPLLEALCRALDLAEVSERLLEAGQDGLLLFLTELVELAAELHDWGEGRRARAAA